MSRRIRATAGGIVYHVLNRGVGRMRLFRKAADFAAMERVLEETFERAVNRADKDKELEALRRSVRRLRGPGSRTGGDR